MIWIAKLTNERTCQDWTCHEQMPIGLDTTREDIAIVKAIDGRLFPYTRYRNALSSLRVHTRRLTRRAAQAAFAQLGSLPPEGAPATGKEAWKHDRVGGDWADVLSVLSEVETRKIFIEAWDGLAGDVAGARPPVQAGGAGLARYSRGDPEIPSRPAARTARMGAGVR